MSDCIFCKIAAGEIGKIIYEDDYVAAFDDLNPQAPVHFLVIPKKHIAKICDVATEEDADLIGRIYLAINKIAESKGIVEDGYRVVTNCNEGAGQSVWHIHFHVLGGRNLGWPPG